jgi:hypothetical protein
MARDVVPWTVVWKLTLPVLNVIGNVLEPDRGTSSGLGLALWAMLSVAGRAVIGGAVGVNTTDAVHRSRGASVAGHPVTVYSGDDEVNAMPVSGTSRLLVSRTVLAALAVLCTTAPNASDVGDSVVGVTPEPLSVTAVATPVVDGVICSVPARVPSTVGVKVTAAWQVAPAATDVPHVLVAA